MLLDFVGIVSDVQKLFSRNFKLMSSITLLTTFLNSILTIFYKICIKVALNDLSSNANFLQVNSPNSPTRGEKTYLAVVWNLALVVSVLEEICGIEALGKAEQLIKGSKQRGFSLNILFGALSLSVFCGVLMSENAAMIPLLLLNSIYCLIEMFKLTTYTVLYHECKETHGEELEMQGGTKYTKVAFTPLISADAP